MKIFKSSISNIYSGGIHDGLKKIIEELNPSLVFVIADENTATLCVPKLTEIIDIKNIIVVKPGEQNKNLDSCQSIWSELINKNADRDSLVLNVGGGMICDMGGFASACYQRGIRFGQIPTTVLSMADAAIGGKLGIDYDGLKNYIGLIRIPVFIWIDPSFLETLPNNEIVSGLAEIVKHAIIGSPSLWQILSGINSVEEIPWEMVLNENIPVKLKIVEADLYEQGQRKVLNFGHTIGHALESYFLALNQLMTHGECVTLGMLVEAKISSIMGLIKDHERGDIVELITRLLRPKVTSLPDFEMIQPWLLKDKKKSGSRVGFSLPDSIGSCRWDVAVKEEIIVESFDWLKAQAKSVPFRLSVDQ